MRRVPLSASANTAAVAHWLLSRIGALTKTWQLGRASDAESGAFLSLRFVYLRRAISRGHLHRSHLVVMHDAVSSD